MAAELLMGIAVLAVAVFMLKRHVVRVTVFEYQHGLRFAAGRFTDLLPPGSYWIVVPATSIQIVEARPRIVTLAGQELLSADGVAFKLSVLVEFRVTDAKRAVLESANYEQSLYAKAQEALRLIVGERTIEDILGTRRELAGLLHKEVAAIAPLLGLELKSIAIKDLMFPGTLKEAFSQTARAKQEAQAALERTRGETAALRNLANAARLLDDHPQLFQLRLLQAAGTSTQLVLNVTPPGSKTESGPSPAP
jgi:regulator of protease activity HflC (stomatin/prohibitin superfamily)